MLSFHVSHRLPGDRISPHQVDIGSNRRSDAAQRAFDCVVGTSLLLLALPMMILAILAVRLTSRGPALYMQARLGRYGRPFFIYKIRSMTHNCERNSGVQWSTKRDVRVTRVGRILRKTHIDELPQLFNILRGQMSLVGPRPERPEIVSILDPAIPHYRNRLVIRPGLTGLAQVQLPPDTDIDSVRRKLRYDLRYATTASVWMDIRLMIATGIHIVGLPFTVSRILLGLPGEPEVEPERFLPSAPPMPSEVETATHSNCHTRHDIAIDAARA